MRELQNTNCRTDFGPNKPENNSKLRRADSRDFGRGVSALE